MSLFTISVVAESFDFTIYAEPDSIVKSYTHFEHHGVSKEYPVNIGRVFVLSSGPYEFKRNSPYDVRIRLRIELRDLLGGRVFDNTISPAWDWMWATKWKTISSIDDINKVGEVFLVESSLCQHSNADCGLWGKVTFDYLKSKKSLFTSVTIKNEVKELGNIRELIKDDHFLYTLGHDLQKPVGIGSPNPKILIGFSSDPADLTNTGAVAPVREYASEYAQDVVYVCLDSDENGDCDFLYAQDACWDDGFDFYKNKCCGVGAEVEPGNYVEDDVNALCTEDKQGNPVWLPVDYVGEIIELSSGSVVSDGSKFMICGQTPANFPSNVELIPDDSIFDIQIGDVKHNYYCFNKEIFECGGDAPFSSFNYFTTAEKFDVPSASNVLPPGFVYCAQMPSPFDMAVWTPFLDAKIFNYTCYKAGFNFTGSKCCEPGDDYEDPWQTQPESKTSGLCQDGKYIPDWQIFDNNLSLVYKGEERVCDAESLHTCINPLFLNPLMDPSIPNDMAVCTPQGWIKGDEVRLAFLLPKQTKWDVEDRGCCLQTECWNGTGCTADGSFFVDDMFYYCADGDWISGFTKLDFTASKVGFCEFDSQCLVDPDFNPSITDPDDYWNDEDNYRPKCIDNGAFILDNYCVDGNWTSRTYFLAKNLYEFLDSSYEYFTIYCDLPGNVLLDTAELENDCSIHGEDIPCVNNICIAEADDEILLATTLNVPVDDSDSFLASLGFSTSICSSGGSFLNKCGEFNSVWYNNIIKSLIYSPGLGYSSEVPEKTFFVDEFNDIKDYIFSLPYTSTVGSDNYAFFRRPVFNNVFVSKSAQSEVFGFLERDKNSLDYLGVDFKSINLGADICTKTFKKFRRTNCEANSGEHYYLTAFDFLSGRPPFSPLPPLTDYWKDLTAKLRLK